MIRTRVSTVKNHMRAQTELSSAIGTIASSALFFACCSAQPAALASSYLRPTQDVKTPSQKEAGRSDGAADQKLLEALAAAMDSVADHSDYSRLDRELAAAFRTYGVDLDVMDPKQAAARLAGHPTTPEIATMIDRWCRLRLQPTVTRPPCAG